jgi:hypothetical protein
MDHDKLVEEFLRRREMETDEDRAARAARIFAMPDPPAEKKDTTGNDILAAAMLIGLTLPHGR